jgi:hypothetical protein
VNGRVSKVLIVAQIMKMKTGIDNGWFPEWDDHQRGSAQRILLSVLDHLDEYSD